MIEDRKIWACAHQVMRQYGEAAGLHAAQRADDLLDDGDLEGHRTWLRILASIEVLDGTKPQGGIH